MKLLKNLAASFVIIAFAYTSSIAAPPRHGRLMAGDHGPVNLKSPFLFLSSPLYKSSPTVGEVKLLVLLTDYADLHMGDQAEEGDFSTPDKIVAYFEDFFFGTDGLDEGPYPYISVQQYYEKTSGNALTFTGDIVGPIQLDESAAWYAKKCGIDLVTGEDGYGTRGHQLVKEALYKAAVGGLNLDDYDADSDGVIDALVVIHPGLGAEEEPAGLLNCGKEANELIWSYHYNRDAFDELDFSMPIIEVGTKKADAYSLVAETLREDGKIVMTDIGVTAHELGHEIGLPDLYDYSEADDGSGQPNGVSYGLGYFDMMAYGSIGQYSSDPNDFSAWTRLRLGWNESVSIREHACNYELTAVQKGGDVLKVWPANRTFEDEYFLISYRPRIGVDKDLPCGGVMVYHVDESKEEAGEYNNWPCRDDFNSCTYHHYLVALEQPDGKFNLEGGINGQDPNLGDDGDCYRVNNYIASITSPGTGTYAREKTMISMKVKYADVTTAVVGIYFGNEYFPDPPQLPMPSDINSFRRVPLYAFVGKTYFAKLGATGIGPFTYTLIEGPEGMYINELTDQLTWPKQFIKTGYHKIRYRITNCAGSITDSFTIAGIKESDCEGDECEGCSCNIVGASSPFARRCTSGACYFEAGPALLWLMLFFGLTPSVRKWRKLRGGRDN